MKIWFIAIGLIFTTVHASFTSRTPNSTWTGTAGISNHSLRVTLQKGYAEVEEDMEIRPQLGANSWNPPSATTPIELISTLKFADGTSMVGMLLWNGPTILKAKLKSTEQATAEYEEVVDRPDAPPPAPRDPALLIRTSANVYDVSIYPAFLNSSRKIRLRYIVPIPPNGKISLLPEVRALGDNVQLLVRGSAYNTVIVHKNKVATSFEVPFSWSSSSFDSLGISVSNSKPLGVLATSFDSGEWKGDYLWLEKDIPDSLKSRMNLRREVVILWKWNMPEHFLNRDGTPSPYGLIAINQAQKLAVTVRNAGMESKELNFGLVHQQQKNVVKTFPLGAYGSPNHQDITDYLEGIVDVTLPQLVPAKPEPSTAQQRDIDSIKVQSQRDLSDLMKKSVALFSSAEGIIKHVVVVSTGPVLNIETPSISDLESLDIPAGITIREDLESKNAWFGVNMEKLEQAHQFDGEYEEGQICQATYEDIWNEASFSSNLCYQADYNVPIEKQVHFTLKLKIDTLQHYLDLDPRAEKIRLAIHSAAPIDTNLTWNAYKEDGSLLATYKDTIHPIRTSSDSAVVKIIAAEPKVISSVYATKDIGPVFGVVRDNFALVALESDSVGSVLNSKLDKEGLPHLTVDEIFYPKPGTPILDHAKKWQSLLKIQPRSFSRVSIMVQGELRNNLEKVEILNLQGKVVASLDVEALRFNGQLEWNGSHEGNGVYLIRIKAGSAIIQRKFILS